MIVPSNTTIYMYNHLLQRKYNSIQTCCPSTVMHEKATFVHMLDIYLEFLNVLNKCCTKFVKTEILV